MRKIFFLLLLGFLVSKLDAQVVAWDFIGATGDEPTIPPTTLDINLTASPISRGAGINTSALANAYSSVNWGAASLAAAITAAEYFQFSISVNPGFAVSLSTLNANFRRSGTGPNSFQWQYSLDGFSTAGFNMGSVILYSGTATAGDAQAPINISGLPSLQNLPAGTVITLRLYGWGAGAATGTFALGRLTGNDLAIGGNNIALPVSLLNFTSFKEGNNNQLRWSTATEINNLGFEIQRSLDGIQFTAIGFVYSQAPGGNSSQVLEYGFADGNPPGNKQYYRLRQVDIDNRSQLSPVVVIKSGKPLLLTLDRIFPNPAGSNVNLVITSPRKYHLAIVLMDGRGRIILQQNVYVQTGSNTIPIGIAGLGRGTYLVKLFCSNDPVGTGKGVTVIKFIKQ